LDQYPERLWVAITHNFKTPGRDLNHEDDDTFCWFGCAQEFDHDSRGGCGIVNGLEIGLTCSADSASMQSILVFSGGFDAHQFPSGGGFLFGLPLLVRRSCRKVIAGALSVFFILRG
jgi:hypothetical protein